MFKKLALTLTPTENEKKNNIKIFLIALTLAIIIFLPCIIYDKGLFIFYGDYNAQQIPFYKLAHNAVRNGEFGLNWNTDLGTNFIASYSFYILGSPFFWLTIPFPNSFVPYLMAPLLILKFAIAALTSYVYIRKFTKKPETAFLASLLYSFSGFSIYNVFYNHFHEIIAFFPLMLIGLENLITNKKKGLFAVAIALNLITNFYFFVAESVFLLIYFIFRITSKDLKISIKTFIFLTLELIIGVGLGFVLFLPSALMIIKNPRVQGTLLGFDMLFYPTVQRYGLLIHSLFFPPDMPSLPNFFPDARAKWFSVAAYMPMFGMTGIIAFFKNNLKDKNKLWLKKLIITLFVFMAIPFLNSSFNGFNSSFYTRWFFSLTLMLALITAISLEQCYFKSAIKINLIVLLCFSLIGILPEKVDNEIVFFNMPEHLIMFWINFSIAFLGVIIVKILTNTLLNNKAKIYKKTILTLSLFIIIYSQIQLMWGKFYFSDNTYEDIITNKVNCKIDFEDKTDEFYRIDVVPPESANNLGMLLNTPCITTFQSTVNPSIMSFYNNLNIKRDVSSEIPLEKYENLRNFLSVKYILIPLTETTKYEEKIPENFKFFKQENGYNIYKNENFLNMGFVLNNYIEKENFSTLSKNLKNRLLINSVVLSKEQIEKYENILTPTTKEILDSEPEEQIKTLRENSCTNFKKNSYGFSATINLKKDSLLVFTVPFEKGFSATVNKENVEIENVDCGLMAIKAKKGENKIEFKYETPGLRLGFYIFLLSLSFFVLYLFLTRKKLPKVKEIKKIMLN